MVKVVDPWGTQGGKGKGKSKHRKDKQCTFTWETAPNNTLPGGGHYQHACGNAAEGDSKKCGGTHLCRNWNCTETRS